MPVSLSVVVPVKDEAGNVAPLAREIAAAVKGEEAEIIFVDDGSTDATAHELTALKAEIPNLRVIRHTRNAGQSRAIRTGVRAAQAPIVATLDGDGQNDPADLTNLVAALRANDGFGMVSGVRAERRDTFSRRMASSLANGLRRRALNDTAVDSGCGIKAFRRDAFLALPYFDHQHRFMTTLMLREGYGVGFAQVNHRPRVHGRSKYTNLQRMFAGISDVLGVRWLQSRYKGDPEPTEL
jgi:glycosyltransferase involved in cell wall biosynthesis